MKKSALAVSAVVALGMVLGSAGAASAYEDSGIGNRGCLGTWGKLTVVQKGSGNSFAPGDYSHAAQWNGDSSVYRTIIDLQSSGTGGGSWRNVTNGDYTSLSTSCSNFG